MLGYEREQLLGSDSARFTHPDDIGITERSFNEVLRGEKSQSRYVKRYIRSDGREIAVEVLRSLARDARGEPLYHVISQRDITDEQILAAELSHQALHDALTGLANRALFSERIKQAMARMYRDGTMFAVLLLDLDEFKGVNDSLGHVAGDQLLVSVARRLESTTRATDTLCRFGGDEFLYLAEGLSSSSDAERTASRLLEVLAPPFAISDVTIEQHASIWVVVSDVTYADATEVIQNADVALYEAKRSGKGQFVLFTPTMHEDASNRFSYAQELRHALQVGHISMHYQPIIDLKGGAVVGFESLMRWSHPIDGMVPPTTFIPIAEQSSLILDLGYFALEQSIAAAVTWERSDESTPPPFISVNLSARQFLDPNLVSTIEDLLRRYGLDSSRLFVEITESVGLVNVAETQSVMEHLSGLGIGFALDDFGTGFSSLSYLALLRPKMIKIDRSFVSPAAGSPRNDVLLEAIVALGHQLNMVVLAEGIETVDQYRRLLSLGCDLAQGFLWSPAVPGREVLALTRGITVT